MIVDDNPDLVYMVKRGLEKLSDEYKVIGAQSGNECFDLLKRDERPSLILLDIMMPEMDGWDVFAEIKQNPDWKNIPIVFLTAKNDSYSKVFGGITSQAYISKPFKIEELNKKIENILISNSKDSKKKINVSLNNGG